MKRMSEFFRMQPMLVEATEHDEPYQRTVYVDEPPHLVRSVGNSVGVTAVRNTNRTTAKYIKKANRKARRMGFNDANHRAIFTALMAERITAMQEAQNGN